MCLAIPARVVELQEGARAVVDLGGIRKGIDVSLVGDVTLGEYVIVHVGFAIGRIDPQEAERTLAMFGEMELLQAQECSNDVQAQGAAA